MRGENEALRKAIDYWREEALIAEESGDEELSEECLRRAEVLERAQRLRLHRSRCPGEKVRHQDNDAGDGGLPRPSTA